MNLYYYLDKNEQQQGPVEASELPKYGVTQNTKVWKQGMSDWQTAGSVSDLYGVFQSKDRSYPQPHPQPQPSVQKPDNLLVWSILATVLCCIPSGIVAIIQSNKVNTLWDARDYAGAQEAARNAKTWCLVSLGLGIIAFVVAFFFGLAGALW